MGEIGKLGGNAIQFARMCCSVVAIDIDPQRNLPSTMPKFMGSSIDPQRQVLLFFFFKINSGSVTICGGVGNPGWKKLFF